MSSACTCAGEHVAFLSIVCLTKKKVMIREIKFVKVVLNRPLYITLITFLYQHQGCNNIHLLGHLLLKHPRLIFVISDIAVLPSSQM